MPHPTPSRPPSPGARAILSSLALCALLVGCKSAPETRPGPSAFALHYHRPASDYSGWTVEVSAGATQASATSTATDGFGAVYALDVKEGASALTFAFKKGGGTDAAGTLSVDVSGAVRTAYAFSGYDKAIPRILPAIPGTNQVALYYARPDKTYGGWGLHLWGDVASATAWLTPLLPAGIDDDLGAGFVFDMKPGGDQVNVVVHNGGDKDPGPDLGFSRAALGDIIFVTSGSAEITTTPKQVAGLAIAGAGAHLLRRDVVAWNVTDAAAASFELRFSATADLKTTPTDVTGGTVLPLTERAAGLGAALEALAPHLQGFRAFDVAAADVAKIPGALQGQLVAVARRADGLVLEATQVQTAFALDDLFSYDGPLGVTFAGGVPTFRLWAPTAQTVQLFVYDASKTPLATVALTRDAQGVWTGTGLAAQVGLYYRYELDVFHPLTGKLEHVAVTDPYAVNLSINGLYAQILDLSDPATKPAGWDALVKPALATPKDIVLYESHLRDFSANDATVPAERRGKYLAFTTDAGATQSNGLRHLATLAAAGLTHVHLLPVFDLASVNEDASERVDVDQPFDRLCAKNPAVPSALCTQFAGKTILEALKSFPGDSDQQQAIAGYLHALDSFNWGYDPFHYGAPEGSYASTPEGPAKVLELRALVKGLSDLGLRTVMDVVYNHTNASGLGDKSVLDKVVPGYYHRRDTETGFVLTSSCCANTATEHHMMERLMIDTLVRWARDYKIDGFRFDLMSLHLKAHLLHAQRALAALTPAADGVDGSKIYLYGEGWDSGELAQDARGPNASQLNMAGTGIGTFNDRLRDAGRGGGPFDSGTSLRKNQGLSSGLYTDPNELGAATQVEKELLGQAVDRIKVSLAGNLADFALITSDGLSTVGRAVGSNGQPSGYTDDPQETINYVSAHDGQTLWDILQYKLPSGRSPADRVRAYDLSLDLVLLGQGIPFVHLGDDLLRSKSMESDSYDSGDWFNRVDWTGASNGWKSGLPNQGKDGASWSVITPRFADATTTPAASDIASAQAHFQDLLKLRKSSRLFRLTTKADVMKRVDFLNAGPGWVPGVIVMTVTDGACGGVDLDPARDALVVIFNADRAGHTLTVPTASGFTLHSVLAASADPVVKTATAAGTQFTVPARTTAVFEQLQGGSRGAGLPCNTHQ